MKSAGGSRSIDPGGQRARVVALPGWIERESVVVTPLAKGTAARIVRYLETYEILVNERISAGLRMAVVQHTREQHVSGCRTVDCARARDWLTPAAPAARVRDAVGA